MYLAGLLRVILQTLPYSIDTEISWYVFVLVLADVSGVPDPCSALTKSFTILM